MAIGIGTALLSAAAVSAGAAYLGSRAQSGAIEDAANTTAAATDRASKATLEMFYKNLGLQEPYRESGYRALTALERELYGSSYDPTLYNQYTYAGDYPSRATAQPVAPQSFLGGTPSRLSGYPVTPTGVRPTSINVADYYANNPYTGRTIDSSGVLTRRPVREGADRNSLVTPPSPGKIAVDSATVNPYPQISMETSPLYKLQLEQGTESINKALASRGLFNSGPGLELLSDFYRQLGATEAARKQALMQLLAGYGGNASTSGANAALSVGNSLGGIYAAGGQNTAAALLAQGNNRANMMYGLGNTINAGLNSYMQYQGMQDYANRPVQYYGAYELPWKY